MHFDKNFIKNVLPKAELLYDSFPEEMNFSIDSRTLLKGDVFVAIPGSKIDGHKFVDDVIAKGAAGLIISNKECISKIDKKKLNDKFVLLVDDTILALRKLATAWRTQFNYPVIGITGSVGKTSTKQIIENILKLHGLNALITCGNQNSLIGLPLNVLRMRKEHQVAVFELGVNKRGEMASLVEIAKPTIALITAVGHSHMEGLGSIVDVASEKREIFKFFKEDNIGIINGDQAPLAQIGYNHPVIKFGSKITNQIQARKIRVVGSQINFVLKIYKKKYNITLNNNHLGSVFNSMAAMSVGCLLNIPNETMIKAIQMPIEVKGRFEQKPLVIGHGKLVDVIMQVLKA
jgi:UDP-N-acetylmuramoyl-tripeptide--D-alanyl-D-alanine ligase